MKAFLYLVLQLFLCISKIIYKILPNKPLMVELFRKFNPKILSLDSCVFKLSQ